MLNKLLGFFFFSGTSFVYQSRVTLHWLNVSVKCSGRWILVHVPIRTWSPVCGCGRTYVVPWGWWGYALLVCVTLAMGCCWQVPAAACWGLWSVTQSPQPWIKLMLHIPSLVLSCAPGGRTTFEQRDLALARGWCLFNMCCECSKWLIPLKGSSREDERERMGKDVRDAKEDGDLLRGVKKQEEEKQKQRHLAMSVLFFITKMSAATYWGTGLNNQNQNDTISGSMAIHNQYAGWYFLSIDWNVFSKWAPKGSDIFGSHLSFTQSKLVWMKIPFSCLVIVLVQF